MRKTILFICIFMGIISANAHNTIFSDSTYLSLITCSPGKEVYAKFGHTAIRINDPVNKIDIVLNYGIFDFNTHNFYIKFVKGETDYLLAATEFSRFLPEYIERNSNVWEQKLNLTQAEKNKLIDLLFENLKPENRIYRYNFVFDNCSTRPRDKILEAFSGKVTYKNPTPANTFREWVGIYVGENTWLKFGIDMLFGRDADVIASRKESMFLPEELMGEFQMAYVAPYDSNESKPIVKSHSTLVQKEPEVLKETFILFRPFPICCILFIIGIILFIVRHSLRIPSRIFDTILFVIAGLIGCILFYLMFFSVHPLVKNNLNILWLNPLFLVVAVTQWFKPLRTTTFVLQVINSILLIIVLVCFTVSLQFANIAFIPLILLLLFRAGICIRRFLMRKFGKGKRKSKR